MFLWGLFFTVLGAGLAVLSGCKKHIFWQKKKEK
jgi:hypothetical protein